MASAAHLTIYGHLGRDPETKPTTGDGSVTTVSVAVTTGRDDRAVTTWWRASVWGTRGKVLAQHLRKGDQVWLTGTPQVREYVDATGAHRFQAELLDAQFAFVGGPRRDAAGGQPATDPAPAAPATTPAAAGGDEPPF